MSIWNKVLIGLIIIASLAFYYLAARTLKTHAAYREKVNGYERNLVQAVDGPNPPDTSLTSLERQVGELSVLLHDAIVDRGRVWRNARRDQFSAATGDMSVTVDVPDPHRIGEKMVLYVFEERPIAEGGGFLGDFKVTGINAKQVALAPVHKFTKRELDRLSATPGPLALYERMPADRHGILEQAALVESLPEAIRSDYLKDGQEAAPTDPLDRVVEIDGQKRYERALRDYSLLFDSEYAWISRIRDLINSAKTDLAKAQSSLEKVNLDVTASDQTIAALKVELDRGTQELATVTAHREALETRLAAVEAERQRIFDENKRLAAAWSRAQFHAVEQIDAWVNGSQANAAP